MWLQYPGPTDAGLAYIRQVAAKFPYQQAIWLGPFLPTLSCHHFDTIKGMLHTAGECVEPSSLVPNA